MNTWLHNLRYTVRMLAKNPGLALPFGSAVPRERDRPGHLRDFGPGAARRGALGELPAGAPGHQVDPITALRTE
jgi:hypothetical protein